MPSLGRYRLLQRVGQGGMAEIWKARAEGPAGFEKILAVKLVLPELANDAAAIGMFSDEAKIAASLNHPNIVAVFDFGAAAEAWFIAMEYVPGANLGQLMGRLAAAQARMPLEVALYIAGEIARGLAHAHARTDSRGQPLHVVHRDVSPQNILLSYDGDVKVSDFGIAKMESSAGRTQAGQVRGKLSYMSPEQACGQPLDRRTDLFSLGVVLFEMVFGHKLHSAEGGEPELYRRVVQYSGPPEGEIETLPAAAAAIVRKALQRDLASRFQDGTQVEAAIAAALGVEGAMEAKRALAAMLSRLVPEPIARGRAVVEPRLRSVVTVALPLEFDEEISELVHDPASGDGDQEPSRTIPSAVRSTETSHPEMPLPSGSSEGTAERTVEGTVEGTVERVRDTATNIERARGRSSPPPWAGQGAIVALVGAVTILGAAWFASSFEFPASRVAESAASPHPSIPPAIPVLAHDGRVLLAARPPADVWIDGKQVATQAATADLRLAPGSHQLHLVGPRLARDFRIDVPADRDTRLTFDGASGRLTLQP